MGCWRRCEGSIVGGSLRSLHTYLGLPIRRKRKDLTPLLMINLILKKRTMKQFKVYANPQEKYEAIKQGWSWPAFFFGIIWALVKKMWLLGFGIWGVGAVLILIGESIEGWDALMGIASFVLMFVFGKEGNRWREKNLISRGFDFKSTVSAANSEDAIALCIKENSKNKTAND
uniref:DUF2628 domain-containing protein n=1 Tax=Candidatus Kentrum sp. TC TaxID=2126339 RepID=A0A450YSW3_9GAMM|nr:MAG: Protein of unknown function (DUF2628) [Candidatus Kentron sp. TC]